MKMKTLSIACAIALGVAGQAIAHTGNHITTPHNPVPTVTGPAPFISGASAQQLTLGKIAEGMFLAGTIHVYYDTLTSGKDYRAYSGTVTGTGDPLLDGKTVLIHNRAKGGSVWGVNPVARAESITRMAIDSGCVPTANVYPVEPQYLCPGIVNAIPDAGVSDVEPGMFVSINVATGDSELTVGERARLTTASQNAVIFGVAVTNNLPASLADNLTHTQVTSMLTGAYQDWGKMGGSSAQPVVVCRRVNGSGSQAAFNANFNKFPCTSSFAPPLAATGSPGSYQVIENSTSGAVKTCLNDAYAAGRMAIGVLSTESVPNSVPGIVDNWHHAKLDGVSASKTETATGAYDFFVEQSFQTRNVNVCVGGTHTGSAAHLAPCHAGEINVSVPNATMAAFLNTFVARSGNPAYLSVLPGVAALPTLYDPTFNPATGLPYPLGQVLKGTRQGSTCAPTQLFY